MPPSPFTGMPPPYTMPPYGAYPNPYGFPPYFGGMMPQVPHPHVNLPFRPFTYGLGAGAGAILGGMYGGMQRRRSAPADAQRVVRPSEIKQILPSPSDTSVDGDLSKLLRRAARYGENVDSSKTSRRKYTKYVFLSGMLLAKRGLPTMSHPDDPDDVCVKLLSYYLADPMRMGPDSEGMLYRALHSHHRHHRRHRHSSQCRRRKKGSTAEQPSKETQIQEDGEIIVQDERNESENKKARSRSSSRSRRARSREPTMSDESGWAM